MAETVGRVQIVADVDGRDLDRQVKALGEKIGATLSKNLSKKLDQEFAKLGKDLEKNLGKSVDKTTDSINKNSKALDRNAESIKKTADRWKNHEGLLDKVRGSYRRMDGTVRLVIGSIIAGADQIAALGPAIGAGLVVLGGGVAAFGLGAGVMYAGLKDLNGEIENLGPNARKARGGLDALGNTLSDLQDDIEETITAGLEDFFLDLESTVSALRPSLLKVAEAARRTMLRFGEWASAPDTVDRLNTFISRSAEYFEDALAAVGRFGDGLVTMFASSGFDKNMREFIGWIDDLGKAFQDFAESPKLDEWFQHASDVFGSVGGLLEATGRALAEMVTDESVGRLTDTLDTVAETIPDIAKTLETIGKLNVFGILAEGIQAVFDILQPLNKPLGDLFENVSNIVSVAIDEWADDLTAAAEVAAPLIQALADALGQMDDDDIRALADGLIAIAGGLLAVKAASAGVALLTTLGSALKNIKGTKVSWKGILGGLTAAALVTALTAIFTDASPDVESSFQNMLTDSLMGAVAGWKAGPAGILVGALLGGLVSTIKDTWDDFDWDDTFGDNTLRPSDSWLTRLFKDWDNGVLNPLYDSIGESFSTAFKNIDLWGDDFFNKGGLVTSFEGIRDSVNNFFYDLSDDLAEGWNGMTEDAEVGIANFRDSVIEWFQALPTMLSAWFVNEFWPGVVTWWNDGWANTAASFANGWEQIVTWWTDMQTATNDWFNNTLWPGLTKWWNDGWVNTVASFTNGWNQIVKWWNQMRTDTNNWFNNTLWPGVVTLWNGGWQRTVNSFANGWNQIVSWWNKMRSDVNNWFSNTFWPGVVSWWNDGWARTGRSFGNGWDQISSWFTGISSGFNNWLGGFIDDINEGLRRIKNLTGGFVDLQLPGGSTGGGGGMASGGLVSGAQRRLIGEAGPEAVVPLNRSLSLVDPSVRWLSAIAQGKMGAGGGGGGGVVVEAGAIQVNGALDPQATAIYTMNRLAERIAS